MKKSNNLLLMKEVLKSIRFLFCNVSNIIITIFNEFEKKPEERKRYFLKKTFAILNTERSQFEFSNFVNPHDIINDINYTRNSLV